MPNLPLRMVHPEKVWCTSRHTSEEGKASPDYQQPPSLEGNEDVEDWMSSMIFVYHYTINSNKKLLLSPSQHIHVKKRDKIDKR